MTEHVAAQEPSPGGITLAVDPTMLGDRPIDDMFAIVAETGYRAVELAPRTDFLPGRSGRRVAPAAVSAVTRAAGAAGVEIASLMVVYDWASPDEVERQAAVRYWRQAISIASDLGCTRINSELAGDPHAPRRSEAAFWRSMDELLPTLEASGLRVYVEPHPYDFIESGREAARLLAAIGSDRLGYIFCAPHTFYLGGDIEQQVADGGPLLGHVHLADTFRPSRIIVNPPGAEARTHQHLDLGQGEIDWTLVFEALARVAFSGVLTVSVFAWPDRVTESLTHNRAAVMRLGAAAGLSFGSLA